MGDGSLLEAHLGWRFQSCKVAFLCGMGIVILAAAVFLYVLIPFPTLSLNRRFQS
jgi:hypothetical protein